MTRLTDRSSSLSYAVSAVILAAGGGARFTGATHKLLAKIDGEPILRHTLRNVLASNFHAVYLILGAESDRLRESVRDLLEDYPVHALINPDWRSGQFSSLITGLRAIVANPDEPCDGACFVLADQPFVTSATYNALIETSACHPDKIIVPTVAGHRGNPTIFPKRLFAEMIAAPVDDSGGRRWLTPENVYTFECNDPAVLRDIDTITDLPGQDRPF